MAWPHPPSTLALLLFELPRQQQHPTSALGKCLITPMPGTLVLTCRVRKSLQVQQPVNTAAITGASTSPADPFAVVNTLTTVSEGSNGRGRRLLARRSRRSPYLGAVVRVSGSSSAPSDVL